VRCCHVRSIRTCQVPTRSWCIVGSPGPGRESPWRRSTSKAAEAVVAVRPTRRPAGLASAGAGHPEWIRFRCAASAVPRRGRLVCGRRRPGGRTQRPHARRLTSSRRSPRAATSAGTNSSTPDSRVGSREGQGGFSCAMPQRQGGQRHLARVAYLSPSSIAWIAFTMTAITMANMTTSRVSVAKSYHPG
jgi:hypothetical protein